MEQLTGDLLLFQDTQEVGKNAELTPRDLPLLLLSSVASSCSLGVYAKIVHKRRWIGTCTGRRWAVVKNFPRAPTHTIEDLATQQYLRLALFR